MDMSTATPGEAVIGASEYIYIAPVTKKSRKIPAKIDTGADSSAIWASNVEITPEGELQFTLFDPSSPYYTGRVYRRSDYKVRVVRSSNGEEQIRYHTQLKITLGGRTFTTLFTLADRSRNHFPVLIGRRTIAKHHYLVDVARSAVPRPVRNPRTAPLNEEMRQNPYQFHQKYFKQEKSL